jgi:hypothetical protein
MSKVDSFEVIRVRIRRSKEYCVRTAISTGESQDLDEVREVRPMQLSMSCRAALLSVTNTSTYPACINWIGASRSGAIAFNPSDYVATYRVETDDMDDASVSKAIEAAIYEAGEIRRKLEQVAGLDQMIAACEDALRDLNTRRDNLLKP